jgi:selenocysteine lyase/cysteine desulfurase
LSHFPRESYDLAAQASGSNIVCLRRRKGTFQEIRDRLKSSGVDASIREGNLRLAFHFFNQPEEVERLCSVLSQLS